LYQSPSKVRVWSFDCEKEQFALLAHVGSVTKVTKVAVTDAGILSIGSSKSRKDQ